MPGSLRGFGGRNALAVPQREATVTEVVKAEPGNARRLAGAAEVGTGALLSHLGEYRGVRVAVLAEREVENPREQVGGDLCASTPPGGVVARPHLVRRGAVVLAASSERVPSAAVVDPCSPHRTAPSWRDVRHAGPSPGRTGICSCPQPSQGLL